MAYFPFFSDTPRYHHRDKGFWKRCFYVIFPKIVANIVLFNVYTKALKLKVNTEVDVDINVGQIYTSL